MAAANLPIALRKVITHDQSTKSLCAERAFPDTIPQGEGLPAIRYEVLSDRRDNDLSGLSGGRRARIQYDCYAKTRIEADELATAIETLLGNQHGNVHGVWIYELLPDNKYNRLDPPAEGSDEDRYRAVVDFTVHYQHEAL